MKEYKIITKCRSCGSQNLKEVLNFGNFRVVGWGNSLPPKVPLELVSCLGCGLLQLRHTTNPNLLWGEDYGYRSGITQTMREQLAEIAHSVEKMVEINDDDVVVDIGCNDGTLLSSYETKALKLGYDPSENMAKYAEEAGHTVIYDYFDCKKYPKVRKAKAVTAISLFYDLDDPNQFVRNVAEILDGRGVFVIQQNYLRGMLEMCAFDNICHEHLEYYSLHSLEPLLNRHGLEVIDVLTNDINGGSFRVYVFHTGMKKPTPAVEKMRIAEAKFGCGRPETYEDFAQRAKEIARQIHDYVQKRADGGRKVYVYGASTRGGTLLQFCGIDSRQIVGAADRNPDKWGKVMQSTGIPIVSEDEARARADYFLVLPWFFAQGRGSEFIRRESKFLLKGGRIIVPLPVLEIYSGYD